MRLFGIPLTAGINILASSNCEKQSYAYCFGYIFGVRGEHLAIQLLWVTARLLLVTRPIALPTQWMKEARYKFSPLPGVSAIFSAKILER